MELEVLEDLLNIDTDGNKAADNKNVLKKLKQILKKQTKKETNLEVKAEGLPYEAVSVVGNRFVTIKFDIDSKEAVVSDIKVDTRDSGQQNHMAKYAANSKLEKIAREHRGDNGDD